MKWLFFFLISILRTVLYYTLIYTKFTRLFRIPVFLARFVKQSFIISNIPILKIFIFPYVFILLIDKINRFLFDLLVIIIKRTDETIFELNLIILIFKLIIELLDSINSFLRSIICPCHAFTVFNLHRKRLSFIVE